jgi:hypothetical protein
MEDVRSQGEKPYNEVENAEREEHPKDELLGVAP